MTLILRGGRPIFLLLNSTEQITKFSKKFQHLMNSANSLSEGVIASSSLVWIYFTTCYNASETDFRSNIDHFFNKKFRKLYAHQFL